MMNVTGLAQHILTLEPAKNAARLCFYHFLKNLCEANEPVTRNLLNKFYARALLFAHWQENKNELFSEVQACLKRYLTAFPGDDEHTIAELTQAWRSQDLQVVPLETQNNLLAIVYRSLEREIGPQEQFRVLPDGDDRAVAVVLTADKTIRVTVYPPYAKIFDGEISPLCSDFTLNYGSDLLLSGGSLQQLDVGNHTAVRFRFTPEGCKGVFIRGYTFQKYAAMEGGSLHRHPILFYPLKRIEQYFINRKTDPMYVELTGILEKAAELLNQGHPEGVKFGTQALERGKLALEQIFPDDKLVRLLINNLEKTLALEAARQEVRPTPQLAPLVGVGTDDENQAPAMDWATATSMGNWTQGNVKQTTLIHQTSGFVDAGEPAIGEIECEKIRPLNL